MKKRFKLLKIFGFFLFFSMLFSNKLLAQFRVDYPIALNNFNGVISAGIKAKIFKRNKPIALVLDASYALFKSKEKTNFHNMNIDIGIGKSYYFGNGIWFPYFNFGFSKFYYENKSTNGINTELGLSKSFSQVIFAHLAYRRYFSSKFNIDNNTINGNFSTILLGVNINIPLKKKSPKP